MAKVLLFAELREIAGKASFETSVNSVEELKIEMFENWPLLKNKTLSIAVNKQITHENVMLKAEDEIAIMPPFSGG